MNNNTGTATRRGDRGAALMIALVLVAVVGMGTAALFRHLNRSFDDYARFERELIIMHLADAGVDAAIAALRKGNAPETLELALGEGRIHVAVAPADGKGGHRIVSRVELGQAGAVRASGACVAVVRVLPTGAVQRVSWQREKRQ